MNNTATSKIRAFDITGPPGVLGLHCQICTTLIIVNIATYTGEPVFCEDCQDLLDHPDRPIPYCLVDTGYTQPDSV